MQSPFWCLIELGSGLYRRQRRKTLISEPPGTVRTGTTAQHGRRTLLDRCTSSSAVPVVCRCLQRLKEPMAVHLKSQHRLYVAPGILYG